MLCAFCNGLKLIFNVSAKRLQPCPRCAATKSALLPNIDRQGISCADIYFSELP